MKTEDGQKLAVLILVMTILLILSNGGYMIAHELKATENTDRIIQACREAQ